MHPELDVALYPIYQTLNVDNGQWATAIGWVNLAGDERIASFVRGHLVDSWQSQVDRKIAELDVTTISSGLPFDQITRQLDLFLRQPSPELALWSAEKLAQLNALPSDHEQVLRRLLEDEQVRKNFAKPFESFLASKSSSTE
jgi:hypothetical protein